MIKLKVSDLLIDSDRYKTPRLHPKRVGSLLLEEKIYHTVGWVCKYHGKEYGDFVTIVEKKLTKSMLKECAEIFTDQINDTFKQLIGEELTKDKILSWRDFALSSDLELSEFASLAIKILNK